MEDESVQISSELGYDYDDLTHSLRVETRDRSSVCDLPTVKSCGFGDIISETKLRNKRRCEVQPEAFKEGIMYTDSEDKHCRVDDEKRKQVIVQGRNKLRRERNRLAAARSRSKTRERMQQLSKEAVKLEGDFFKLRKEIQKLDKEKQQLTLALQIHEMKCALIKDKSPGGSSR
ncbi:uncharacterized protein LOC144446954 [Glandiceps talaboti]